MVQTVILLNSRYLRVNIFSEKSSLIWQLYFYFISLDCKMIMSTWSDNYVDCTNPSAYFLAKYQYAVFFTILKVDTTFWQVVTKLFHNNFLQGNTRKYAPPKMKYIDWYALNEFHVWCIGKYYKINFLKSRTR